MTTETIAQTVTAGQQATFPQGRIWYIKSAASPLTLIAETLGSASKVRKFVNMPAGAKFKAEANDGGWTYLRVLSAVTQNIELIIGDDDVEIASAVSVTGGVATSETPSSAITASPADVAVLNAAASAIAANAARKRITVGALSTNTGSLRIQSTGAGANRGIELQPGLFLELRTAAAFDIRNDSGATQSYFTFEES